MGAVEECVAEGEGLEVCEGQNNGKYSEGGGQEKEDKLGEYRNAARSNPAFISTST